MKIPELIKILEYIEEIEPGSEIIMKDSFNDANCRRLAIVKGFKFKKSKNNTWELLVDFDHVEYN